MAAIPVPEPPKTEAQVEAKPELDTVRVESDGQAIVAGMAKPEPKSPLNSANK